MEARMKESSTFEVGAPVPFIATKTLVFHGKPIEELSKEELLKALQEAAYRIDRNFKAYLSWKESSDGWKALYKTVRGMH